MIHIRSGQGLARDWPRNLLANPRAVLHINARDIAVWARHVSDRRPSQCLHHGPAMPAPASGLLQELLQKTDAAKNSVVAGVAGSPSLFAS
jgi:hypothetical protein